MARIWIALGALSGLLAVGLSAWAAHAPFAAAPERARLLSQALTMQGWHALALLAVGLLAERRGGFFLNLAGLGFAVGTVLFCGAVWSVAVLGRSLGVVAPTGGVLLMLGWACLIVAALRR
ncbi:MAG: DUF423 domain-containing protein [Azospirillum brasilense]|nr:MAG: DUF423 domain-containing protein [Azospirillum brasilense]